MNRVNTTTPSERSEKEGLAREPRELSCEELESIIGGVAVEAWVPLVTNTMGISAVFSAPQSAQSWGSTSGTSYASITTLAVEAWVPLVTNTMVISAPQSAQSWGSTSGTSSASITTLAA